MNWNMRLVKNRRCIALALKGGDLRKLWPSCTHLMCCTSVWDTDNSGMLHLVLGPACTQFPSRKSALEQLSKLYWSTCIRKCTCWVWLQKSFLNLDLMERPFHWTSQQVYLHRFIYLFTKNLCILVTQDDAQNGRTIWNFWWEGSPWTCCYLLSRLKSKYTL